MSAAPANVHVDRLAEVADRLEAAYEATRAQLERDFADTGFSPEEIRDPNGRYILLDALTALVEARTALARR